MKYRDPWIAARKKKGNTSTRDDKHHLDKWFLKRYGTKAIAQISPDDLREVVERLDEAVEDGRITGKTANNIWSTIRKMCRDSARSKIRALRVRDDDPTLGIEGPETGIKKAKTFLYPSEYLQFVNHKDTPAHWRRVVTLAIYTFLRPGELEALEWGDVDLEHGMINVHQAIDRSRAGVVRQVKTNCPRQVPIEKELLPLLRIMKREAREQGCGLSARVIVVPPVNRLSKPFRWLLKKAGLTRHDLYARDKTRKNMTFYDLRATGITWRAARGDASLEIKHDARHKRFSTTERKAISATLNRCAGGTSASLSHPSRWLCFILSQHRTNRPAIRPRAEGGLCK